MAEGPRQDQRRAAWRDSRLWAVGPAVTLLLFLPVMTRVARLDRYHYSLPNHDGARVRDHPGLFLLYGLALATPSLVAGAVAQATRRRVGLIVAVLTLLLAAMCEGVVSVFTW